MVINSNTNGGITSMKKSCFLLRNSMQLPLEEPLGEYDLTESLNVVTKDGRQIPLVTIAGAPPTHSKTLQAPGDDDPETAQELCY
jgi:hypothetical protein